MGTSTRILVNISGNEITKRKLFGFVFLIPSLLAAAAIIFLHLDVPQWIYFLLFLAVWIGSLGVMQAREKTCVMNALKGTCNMGRGQMKLDDLEEIAALKRKAWRIQVQSFLFALAVLVILII